MSAILETDAATLEPVVRLPHPVDDVVIARQQLVAGTRLGTGLAVRGGACRPQAGGARDRGRRAAAPLRRAATGRS